MNFVSLKYSVYRVTFDLTVANKVFAQNWSWSVFYVVVDVVVLLCFGAMAPFSALSTFICLLKNGTNLRFSFVDDDDWFFIKIDEKSFAFRGPRFFILGNFFFGEHWSKKNSILFFVYSWFGGSCCCCYCLVFPSIYTYFIHKVSFFSLEYFWQAHRSTKTTTKSYAIYKFLANIVWWRCSPSGVSNWILRPSNWKLRTMCFGRGGGGQRRWNDIVGTVWMAYAVNNQHKRSAMWRSCVRGVLYAWNHQALRQNVAVVVVEMHGVKLPRSFISCCHFVTMRSLALHTPPRQKKRHHKIGGSCLIWLKYWEYHK